MNYDQLNKIHDYWRKDILPHLIHQHTVNSYDDYLRKLSFLPSFKWLKDMEKVKINRVLFAIDPHKLIKKYKSQCITYNAPAKPEDGLMRVIYQLSPTLHMEVGIWVWIEHEIVQSYASAFVCYNEEEDFLKLSDDLYKMRREGNTEEKPTHPGFFIDRRVEEKTS